MTIVDPMQKSSKDMESVRKQFVDDGVRLNKELHDTFICMKKLKQVYEDAQASSNEAALASQKAVTQTYSKGAKNIEKVATKAQTAQDKAQQAYEAFLAAEVASKNMQEKFFKTLYPELMNNFKQREFDRLTEIHGMLTLYCEFNKNGTMNSLGLVESLEDRLRLVDIDADIKNFAEDHMSDNNITNDNVSVVSLMNPHKTGRLKYKSKFLDL